MVENNQLSGNMKNSSTGTSSTNASSEAIGKHENEIVPHKISNHDKLVQTMVMVDGEWVNINDTNDQKNVQEDMHKVNRVVTEAQKDIINAQNTADSAVKSADSAISASKVNSDAIAAQEEAISEAKNALGSVATEIQLTASNAASDAASIRADVAKVESEVASAKSASQDSVNALQSDVDAAKKDLADAQSGLSRAQAAVEQNKELINDSVAKINNDIAQNRKDLAAAQQANADTAKKLDSYTKQAIEQGKTIEELQTDDNSTKMTIANIKGDVSQVQDSVTGLTANLKDANDNLATVKALADSLSSTLTDHGKNIASLQATTKELSSTLGDADGRLSKAEQTAKEQSTTLSNVQGSLSQVKQTADGLTDTLKDAQGNITKVQTTVKGLSEQITNAQGSITSLQTDVTGIKATITDHENDIHTLQADAKSLTDDMTDAQGNISSLQKTSTDLTSEMQDHDGRLSKVEQTAGTLTNEFSDEQGHLNRVEQTAQGTQQTVANQQGQINNIKTDAAGMHQTITGQGNQIANINVTLSGLNTKYEGVSGDLNNLKSQAQWATVTSAVDLNNVKTPCHEFLKGTVTNAPNETAWWYLTVEGSEGDRITQTVIAEQSNNRYTRRLADSWSAWVRDATQTDVTALSNSITTNSTQITQNKQAIDLKADQSTVDNLSGEVSQNTAQLKVQADQISSKVSSEDFKTLDNKVGGAIAQIDKNATAIDQTNKDISLKADQTEVDTIKGTASHNSSRLDVMAGQISSKVTATDVNNIVDKKGYATTSTVQSLITQTAGTISESITNLDAKYNTTVTQVQSLTASIDGLQSTVANKADKSQITQLANLVQSKVSSSDFNSKITQLANDINLRVTKGDLLSQINIAADNTLIQSGKIYFDAKSVVFGKDSEAFIPAALITNLTADQITTGALKSIQIDNGNGSFTVTPDGDVTANSIKLRNGQFLQGTIAGSTIYAINNDGAQDPKLAPENDWYKITPNMIRWFNHYDQSVGQIGVGQGVLVEGPSEFTGTPGLTISDSAKILLGTAQRTIVTGDEIGNLETTGLDWMSKTNLEIKTDGLKVNLDPDQGNEYDGKGAEFAIQKDNKISAYFGSGDHGDELSITTAGCITFNAGLFDVNGEVHIPDHGITVKDLHVTRWLGVDGSKNSIVNTSQGTVAINAYETAEYYFGDIGEGQTSTDGIAYIGIEKLFNETVNTTIPYQVFITAYGPGNVWVEQRKQDRFMVKSSQPNIKFGWEIKAKRKGYEHTRLQNVDNKLNHMEATS